MPWPAVTSRRPFPQSTHQICRQRAAAHDCNQQQGTPTRRLNESASKQCFDFSHRVADLLRRCRGLSELCRPFRVAGLAPSKPARICSPHASTDGRGAHSDLARLASRAIMATESNRQLNVQVTSQLGFWDLKALVKDVLLSLRTMCDVSNDGTDGRKRSSCP